MAYSDGGRDQPCCLEIMEAQKALKDATESAAGWEQFPVAGTGAAIAQESALAERARVGRILTAIAAFQICCLTCGDTSDGHCRQTVEMPNTEYAHWQEVLRGRS